MKKTFFKVLLFSTLSLIPSLSFAGGCEIYGMEEPFVRDKEECEMLGGQWFTCTVNGQEDEFVRDRFECEVILNGIWSSGPSNPSINSPLPTLSNDEGIILNGKLIFDGKHLNKSGLWISDISEENSLELKVEDKRLSNAEYFRIMNNKVYFMAQHETYGTELFVTDGTSEGTKLVKDMSPGTASTSNYENKTNNFLVANNKLYFTAFVDAYGTELWISDGTSDGTYVVDIAGPNKSSFPQNFIEYKGKAYFSAQMGDNKRDLYVSDGTVNGTKVLKDINLSINFSNFFIHNNKLYFKGRSLWESDGTEAGTKKLDYLSPSFISPDVFNNKLYYSSSSTLFVSDFTSNGTKTIKFIGPNSYIQNFFLANNKLFFTANTSSLGRELWVSDGSEAGTKLLKDMRPGTGSSNAKNFISFNNKLYLLAHHDLNEFVIWLSDGTSENTIKLDIKTETLFKFNNKLYTSVKNSDGTYNLNILNENNSLQKIEKINSSKDLNKYFISENKLYIGNDEVLYLIDGDNISKLEHISMTEVNQSIKPFSKLKLDKVSSEEVKIEIEKAYGFKGELSSTSISLANISSVQTALQNIDYTPAQTNTEYTDIVKITITDATNKTSSYEHKILVSPIANEKPSEPSISSNNLVLDGTSSIIGNLSSTDVDSTNLSFSIVSGNDNGYYEIDSNNNLALVDVNNTPSTGKYEIVIKVSDGVNEVIKNIVFYVSEPISFNYQGFLSKAGEAVNEELTMTFKLYEKESDLVEKWSTSKTVTVKDGIYNVVLGLGEDKTLNSLDMLNKNYYMGITIESNSEMTPRQLFKPSGYIELLQQKVKDLENRLK